MLQPKDRKAGPLYTKYQESVHWQGTFSGASFLRVSGPTHLGTPEGHFQFTETELFKESPTLTELNLLIRVRQHLGEKQLLDSARLAPAYLKLTTACELEN